ncbi:uncharacterized protein LOC125231253 [Leguminivora glycinivorella]|uniref:uncharacterized protein LOC125231253 n=1 Tax=Leguminivora glycinivorella TaxID=1035111 RepID=UPI00200C660C|nr:uncharacterized protein LOC125231253 [Leguminivora glycinivorella]
MMSKITILAMLVVACAAQRSFYGRRPIGYPVLEQPSTESNALGDRFGTGETTTTQRLPIEALGDQALVDQLSKLPQDKQPFWLLNWRALEQHRQQHPTFQHGQSNFINGQSFFNPQNLQS